MPVVTLIVVLVAICFRKTKECQKFKKIFRVCPCWVNIFLEYRPILLTIASVTPLIETLNFKYDEIFRPFWRRLFVKGWGIQFEWNVQTTSLSMEPQASLFPIWRLIRHVAVATTSLHKCLSIPSLSPSGVFSTFCFRELQIKTLEIDGKRLGKLWLR